jgi:hypothetical protein
MLVLYNSSEIILKSLIPGSCSIKGSFTKEFQSYLVYGISKITHSSILISSYPTFHEAKEAISQITLAMDKIQSD